MGKITIVRKKSVDLKMPYSVLIDGNKIGEIENGMTKEFEVSNGEHMIVITSGSNNEEMFKQIGMQFGLLGVLIGKLLGKFIIKSANKKKKNQVLIDITAEKELTITCKAGALDAVIKSVE